MFSMEKYYFLGCSLPSISLGQKPDVSYFELKKFLDWNLTESDKLVLYDFLQYIDIKNLKSLWLNKPIDLRGNLDLKMLNEAMLAEDFFPDFVFEYLKKNETTEQRIENFSFLLRSFLNYHIQNNKNVFLKSYFTFERETKLLLLALRSKEFKFDISLEMESEDKTDFLVQYILSHLEQAAFEVPKEYVKLQDIFLQNSKDPKGLYRQYLEYCLEKFSEMEAKEPFIIDQILGYITSLMLVEDYYYLDKEKGKTIVNSLL